MRFRDGIGRIPCDRRQMCGGLSSLGGLRKIQRHLSVIGSGLSKGLRSVSFSHSSVALGMRNVDLALYVVRHRPLGYVGFRNSGSPVPLGL